MIVAATSAWTYVTVTYVATVGLLGGYAAWVVRKGRKVGAQLAPDERRWSS